MRAASKIFFSSATPVWIAESCTNVSLREAPMRRATVVLPLPGGPQKIIDPSQGAASRRVSAPFGPVRCSWPDTSASVIGRSRSASGAGGGSGLGSRPSRRLMALCPARAAHCPSSPYSQEPSHEFLRPALRPLRNAGVYSGKARAADRNHGASSRGEEGSGHLHADREARQDHLPPIGWRT